METKITLTIDGMSCQHCVNSAKQALEKSEGVKKAKVDLKKGKAYVKGENLDAGILCKAVEEAGYSAKPE